MLLLLLLLLLIMRFQPETYKSTTNEYQTHDTGQDGKSNEIIQKVGTEIALCTRNAKLYTSALYNSSSSMTLHEVYLWGWMNAVDYSIEKSR
jgi:hypothetical protein